MSPTRRSFLKGATASLATAITFPTLAAAEPAPVASGYDQPVAVSIMVPRDLVLAGCWWHPNGDLELEHFTYRYSPETLDHEHVTFGVDLIATGSERLTVSELMHRLMEAQQAFQKDGAK